MMFSSDGFGSFGFASAAIAAVLLVGAWVILAGSRFIQGGVVERPERVPQLYGYTACLIGLIWALGSAVSVVESVQTLASPAHHQSDRFGMEPSITSFEAFRLTYDRARRFGGGDPREAQLDTVPEPELRKRYAIYRADRIESTVVDARQSIVKQLVALLLAAGLFLFHWRWLQRRADGPTISPHVAP